MKTETFPGTFSGKLATLTRVTSTMTTPMAATATVDTYMSSTRESLGGHLTLITKGEKVVDQKKTRIRIRLHITSS